MTKRQTLEREVMQAIQRYRIDSHKSETEGVQTAVDILGKFAPYPDSIKRFIEVPKPVKKRWWRFWA